MSQTYLIVIIVIGVATIVAAGVFFLVSALRARGADDIRNDPNPLARWTYTPAEWQQAVADEFTWGRSRGNSAQIRICQLGFLVEDGAHARVFELETGTRLVTFAGYVPIEGGLLKLRVRRKKEIREFEQYDQSQYSKDDYRIPVPLREQAQAQKVVDFFMTKLQNNLDTYAQLVADDDSISLFGKDSF